MIDSQPSDEACREATRLGVPVSARVTGPAADALAELRRLSRYGAALIAIVESHAISPQNLRHAAPNLLLAQPMPADSQPFLPAPWAQAIAADVDDPARFAARVGGLSLPIIARRRLASPLPIAVARLACDDLQRDLAPHGDYSGYVV